MQKEFWIDTNPWPKPDLAQPTPAPAPAAPFYLNDSVSFFVTMQTGMASDTSLLKLGMVSVSSTCVLLLLLRFLRVDLFFSNLFSAASRS